MRRQQIPRVPGEPVPADKIALEPDAEVVLNGVVARVGEAEAVRRDAVLVVYNLGTLALPPDISRGTDLESAVLAGGDVLRTIAVDPDLDMLPVVTVARVQEVLQRDVLLEVIGVVVHAPAIVTPLARVHVVVQQVRLVTAVLGQPDPAVLEALDDATRRVDGGHVVAAVGVKVEDRLPSEVVGRGRLRERPRGVRREEVGGHVMPGAVGGWPEVWIGGVAGY